METASPSIPDVSSDRLRYKNIFSRAEQLHGKEFARFVLGGVAMASVGLYDRDIIEAAAPCAEMAVNDVSLSKLKETLHDLLEQDSDGRWRFGLRVAGEGFLETLRAGDADTKGQSDGFSRSEIADAYWKVFFRREDSVMAARFAFEVKEPEEFSEDHALDTYNAAQNTLEIMKGLCESCGHVPSWFWQSVGRHFLALWDNYWHSELEEGAEECSGIDDIAQMIWQASTQAPSVPLKFYTDFEACLDLNERTISIMGGLCDDPTHWEWHLGTTRQLGVLCRVARGAWREATEAAADFTICGEVSFSALARWMFLAGLEGGQQVSKAASDARFNGQQMLVVQGITLALRVLSGEEEAREPLRLLAIQNPGSTASNLDEALSRRRYSPETDPYGIGFLAVASMKQNRTPSESGVLSWLRQTYG